MELYIPIDIPNPKDIPQESLALLLKILYLDAQNTAHKYIKGQLEHGGFLLDRDLDNELMMEIIDIKVYHWAKMIKDRGLEYKDMIGLLDIEPGNGLVDINPNKKPIIERGQDEYKIQPS